MLHPNENTQIDSINKIIVSNPLGENISLEKISTTKLETPTEYKEVFISNLSMLNGTVTQSMLQIANQGLTLAQIAKNAPNGLFTSTVDPTTLTKFKNGTISTIIKNSSGEIVEHAGFSNVNMQLSINPAIVLSAGMQAMAAISGTYYLHKIDSQIKVMNTKLEELLTFHHDKNIGLLIVARKALSEISKREHVDAIDLNAIRSYKKSVDEVHEEYVYRLKRLKDDLNIEKDLKLEEEKLKDINFTITIAFEASKLSLFAELIEISTRMKIGNQMNIIEGLTTQLRNNYENSFYHNIEIEIENTFFIKNADTSTNYSTKNDKYQDSLESLKDINIFKHPKYVIAEAGLKAIVVVKQKNDLTKAKKQYDLANTNLESIKDIINENKTSDAIDKIINEIIELPNKEKELIFIPTNNENQRVFIPISHTEDV